MLGQLAPMQLPKSQHLPPMLNIPTNEPLQQELHNRPKKHCFQTMAELFVAAGFACKPLRHPGSLGFRSFTMAAVDATHTFARRFQVWCTMSACHPELFLEAMVATWTPHEHCMLGLLAIT